MKNTLKIIPFLLMLAYSAQLFAGTLENGDPDHGGLQVEISGKGRPMILIPGLTSSGEVWNETVARYKSLYECHVVTLPGFAGNPAVDYGDSYLSMMQELLMNYIVENKLEKPVIVGHSLGGFLALNLGKDHPDKVGELVIVDSLPFLTAIQMPGATEESAKVMAGNMKQMMLNSDPKQSEGMQRMMLGTMINSKEDIETAYAWGLASDRETVAQAMYELYTTDIRMELNKIQSPILVLGAWIAYKQYGVTRDTTLNNYKTQYQEAKDCRVRLTDKGKHFIMWDDPAFLYREMDSFLAVNP